jgi:D-alanyl-D-alanine carboxypeptidase/D-alanyl-D-alanine-endopeptidase (penicillin-binding protein 4)
VTQPIFSVAKKAKDLASVAFVIAVLSASFSPAVVIAKPETASKTSKESSKSDSSEDTEKKSRDDDSSDSRDEDKQDKSGTGEDESESTDSKQHAEATPSVLTTENVAQKLSNILEGPAKNSKWGVKVEVTETGQSLFELNADEGFIPASNRKLFTGALALDQLGPDFVFRTYLYQTGTVDANGTLNGNLVIVPTGDPTFSKTMYKGATPDWVFRDWAAKVKAAGIKYVKGDLLVDCSAWDMNDLTPQGWPARIMNDSYAPQTSPLTINENITNIFLTPTKDGQPAAVSFAPPATGYPVVNNTVSGKPGGPVAKRVGGSHIEVRGGISSKKTIWSIPIDRPTLYAAANFRHHLMEGSVPVQGSVRIITAPGTLPGPTAQNTIAMVQSPKLIDIIDYMMKRSDNHMAEQIYVAVSNARLGKGSYGNSRRLEEDLLRRAQIDPARVHCYDGCGLSESNRVAPADVSKLLSFMHRHPYAQQYYDCMAISGRDGTLRNRMSSISGRVHAKTGTINNVKTLSGYIALSAGKTLSFSFLVNKISGSSPSGTQDRLCTTLAQLVLDQAPAVTASNQ